MPGGCAAEKEIQIADCRNQADDQADQRHAKKHFQRLFGGIDPDNRSGRTLDIAPHALKQARLSQLFVCADLDVRQPQLLVARIDDCLQRIGVFAGNVDFHGRIPAIGAKTAGRIRNFAARCLAHHAAACLLQLLFEAGEMLDAVRIPIADDHLGFSLQNRLYQRRNIPAVILVVAVCIDDDIRAQPQAGIQPSHKALGQPAVVGEPHDMVHAQLFCHFHRPIRAPVVDNERLDLVDSIDLLWQIGKNHGQRLLFIITGDLYD